MNMKSNLEKAMNEYRRITGLRSYLILDDTIIESASERNFFCKSLKVSTKALKKCEECTIETYNNARGINSECIYSCHAGLIKWAVPVNVGDFHCVIVSEGILAKKQKEEAEEWTTYLAKEYDLDQKDVKRNFSVVTTMDEAEMKASIQLLKDLVAYYTVTAIHHDRECVVG